MAMGEKSNGNGVEAIGVLSHLSDEIEVLGSGVKVKRPYRISDPNRNPIFLLREPLQVSEGHATENVIPTFSHARIRACHVEENNFFALLDGDGAHDHTAHGREDIVCSWLCQVKSHWEC